MPKLRLHIGCGNRIIEGWENRDLIRPPKGTVCFNALKKWTYPDDSSEIVYCEDFLEHLHQHEQYIFFAESYRVLCAGGILRINVPDALWSLENWVINRNKKGIDSLHLAREFYPSEHKMVPTKSYLAEVLPLFGFSKVVLLEKDQSLYKDFVGDMRPVIFDNPLINRAVEGQIYLEALK